jgi:hypothetical protein
MWSLGGLSLGGPHLTKINFKTVPIEQSGPAKLMRSPNTQETSVWAGPNITADRTVKDDVDPLTAWCRNTRTARPGDPANDPREDPTSCHQQADNEALRIKTH